MSEITRSKFGSGIRGKTRIAARGAKSHGPAARLASIYEVRSDRGPRPATLFTESQRAREFGAGQPRNEPFRSPPSTLATNREREPLATRSQRGVSPCSLCKRHGPRHFGRGPLNSPIGTGSKVGRSGGTVKGEHGGEQAPRPAREPSRVARRTSALLEVNTASAHSPVGPCSTSHGDAATRA